MSVPQKLPPPSGDIMEAVLIKGDLARLTPAERVRLYDETCRSLGLNPLTKPFDYIELNGKLQLYAKRDAADQLRKLNGISIQIVSQDVLDSLLSVHVRATDKTGRTDEDLGVVVFVYPARYKDPRDKTWKAHPKAGKPLDNEERANAVMKCVTKAKRRVTLSISGLGYLDETEADDIPGVRRPKAPGPNVIEPHDPETGEIIDPPPSADDAPEEPADAAPPPGAPSTVTPEAGSGAAPDDGLDIPASLRRAPQREANEPAMVRQPRPMSIEDLAREAARHGEEVFRNFYRKRDTPEQKRINAIGDELRELMNEAAIDAAKEPQ